MNNISDTVSGINRNSKLVDLTISCIKLRYIKLDREKALDITLVKEEYTQNGKILLAVKNTCFFIPIYLKEHPT